MTFYLKDEYGNIARQAAWYLCCLSKFAMRMEPWSSIRPFSIFYFALEVFPLEFCVSGIQTFKNKLGANVYLVNLFRKNLKDKRKKPHDYQPVNYEWYAKIKTRPFDVFGPDVLYIRTFLFSYETIYLSRAARDLISSYAIIPFSCQAIKKIRREQRICMCMLRI